MCGFDFLLVEAAKNQTLKKAKFDFIHLNSLKCIIGAKAPLCYRTLLLPFGNTPKERIYLLIPLSLVKSHCFVFCKQLDNGKVIPFRVKNLKDIELLERYRKKAEELFYLDTEKVQEVIDIRKQLESGTLFDKLYKKV